VITDLSMPRNDGLWLTDWIRARDGRRGDHLPRDRDYGTRRSLRFRDSSPAWA
jgi:CheY-like chemotaxis protein